MSEPILDCAVIGAGPAGLTAAIYLGRYRRRFIVLHDAEPRAAWIPLSHNYPGFPDGVTGPDLLDRLTRQAQRYGARIERAAVTGLTRSDQLLELETAGKTVRARTVLLATGVDDNEPPLPGVKDAIRRGLVRICPICDGFEVFDRSVGVLGDGARGAREALFLRTWSDRVTLIHTAGSGLKPDERAALNAAAVEVIEAPVDTVDLGADEVLAFTSGGQVRRFDTVYSALGVAPRHSLAIQAGARISADGRLDVDDHQRTSVEGLWAAGDIVKGLNQIGVAVAEAAIAATDIHNQLPANRVEAGLQAGSDAGFGANARAASRA